jgi:hypothetical protein
MSDLLRTLAAYVPPNIARTTLSAAFPEPPTRAAGTLFPGAVLFADVSGFTPLTEALAQKGAEGPEELTRLLNGYFSRMIAITEAQGGEVVKFSGDAVTVVFPAADEALGVATRRALQTAEAMQAAMSDFATLDTSVGPVELGMKIAIGAGEVLAAQVGGVRNRWEYVVAGDPLRQVPSIRPHGERSHSARKRRPSWPPKHMPRGLWPSRIGRVPRIRRPQSQSCELLCPASSAPGWRKRCKTGWPCCGP